MSSKFLDRFPGYAIHSDGYVVGLNGRRLKCKPGKDGYVRIGLKDSDGLFKAVYLHRIIAACFLGLDLDDGSIEVDHRNNDRSDCKLSNLQLLTCSQNNLKAADNDLWIDVSTTSGFKICRRCKTSKPMDHFGKNKRHTDGLHSYCKECVRQLSYGN